MSYTPTEWESADIVTATRMNRLETAVGDANMSYTPNTWSDGDILTASKMNALEQAVAGGGGVSDFSTAEVTLSTLSTGGLSSLPIASIVDNEIHTTIPFFIKSFEAILYKGSQVCDTSEITGTITVSGDAVYDSDEQTITITGDCTITIS